MKAVLTRPERDGLRRAMPELVTSIRPTHHLTFTLDPGCSMERVEGAVAAWVPKINRHYIGRSWHLPRFGFLRMQGLAFFEYGRSGQDSHIHELVRPPARADSLHFKGYAPHKFAGGSGTVSSLLKRPLGPGAALHVQRIGGDPGDISRLVGYGTKEMEFRPAAYAEWKFIDDLTSFRWQT